MSEATTLSRPVAMARLLRIERAGRALAEAHTAGQKRKVSDAPCSKEEGDRYSNEMRRLWGDFKAALGAP